MVEATEKKFQDLYHGANQIDYMVDSHCFKKSLVSISSRSICMLNLKIKVVIIS